MNRKWLLAWLICFVSIVGTSSSAQTPNTQRGKTHKEPHFVGKGSWAGVDFANFTYRKTCLGENVRVVNAHASRGGGPDTRTLYVTGVQYGDITGDGRDDAVVLALCEWSGAANPGAYPKDIYIYEIVRGQPTFVTEFKEPPSNPGDLPRGIWEADLVGFKVANGTLSVEHFAGEARCCPTLYVTRTYRWVGSSWSQVAVKTRPYESR